MLKSNLRPQSDLTEEESEFVHRFIDNRKWTNSKTYENVAPHEYTIKQYVKDGYSDFIRFIELIHNRGFERKYYKSVWIYLLIDGWEYFTHNYPTPPFLNVINRARPPETVVEKNQQAEFWVD